MKTLLSHIHELNWQGSLRVISRYGMVLLSVAVLLQSTPVFADTLSPSDLNGIIGSTPWYDPNACAPGSGTTPNSTIGSAGGIPIDNNAVNAYNFLTSNGYTAIQAAGIVGNLMYESQSAAQPGGVNPTQGEIGGGGGYGIAQFTPPSGLIAWAASNNADYTTLETQEGYLLFQLNGSESAAKTAIKATDTINDATEAFERQYERPADWQASLNDREARANAIYQHQGGSVSTGSGGSDCTSGTTAVNCQTATGDAKILCEARQYEGIFYTFGGAHQGYAPFRQVCPISSIANATKTSTLADPGPCSTDCSGLVSVAVDQAFNQSYMWVVAGTMNGAGSEHWHAISMNDQLQPGDIVTTSEHVEIVDHVSGGNLYTFGSHQTGTRTGPSNPIPIGTYYTAAYRYK